MSVLIDKFFGAYRFLSNFYPSPITYNGHNFPTVEHGYQYYKFICQELRVKILKAPTPAIAKKIANENKESVRVDWQEINMKLMEDLLRLKFAPGSELAERLLKTDNAELVEGNYWGDRFWGVCYGEGKNHLGKLLMKIREELRHE